MDSAPPPPWWETAPVGAPLLVSFVVLDREGSAWTGTEPLDPQEMRQRARYTAGIEFVASTLGAAQPLQWRGNGVRLFFQGDERMSAVLRALRAAEAIRERAVVDLALRVRLAVHAAVVAWNPDTAAMAHPALDLCAHLERITPVDGITVTEDVFLALPEGEQRRFAALGMMARVRMAAYVFPRQLRPSQGTRDFQPDGELNLRHAFRQYASSPEIRRLRYVGFPLQKKQPPSLDIREVFIAPEARLRTRPLPLLPVVSQWLEGNHLTEKQLEPTVISEPVTRLLRQHRALMVLGDPGAGKTTVLRWLAVVAAAGPLTWAEQLGEAERLLPLMVSVGRLAELHERLGSTGTVLDALCVYFHDRNIGARDELRGFLERALDAGECLVLLDGLDEVRSEVRTSLLSWLETFCARFPSNRFVASARVVGYTGFSLPHGVETTLSAFNDEQVRRYAWAFERACRRWENEGLADDVSADRESGKLLDALFKSSRLRDLARNPFLLSALVLIHRAEGQLPRHRVQAYEIFSRTLCETWSNARRVVAGESETRSIRYEEEAVPILGELALRMHQDWPSGAAPEAFVIQTLAQAIQARDGCSPQEAERAAKEFLERAGKDVQILLERGAGQWGFLHLTFQEFFTAVGLLSSERFEEVAVEHLFEPRWEEVLRLGVGYMAIIQKRAQATQRFIREVMVYQERGEREYLTKLLGKQIYLSALLASEAGDTLPLPLQYEVARNVVDWNQDVPKEIVKPLLDDLALTDFKERLVDVLIPVLESREEKVRDRAVSALGSLSGERALTALFNQVRDPSKLVRSTLSLVLMGVDSPRGREARALLARDDAPLVLLVWIAVFFSRWILNQDPADRAQLSSLARKVPPEMTDKFIMLLKTFLPVQIGMGGKMGEAFEPEMMSSLIGRGLEHREQRVRSDTKEVMRLRDFMEDRGSAQSTLEEAVTGETNLFGLAFKLMLSGQPVPDVMLTHADSKVRMIAAYAVALQGDERGVLALITAFRTAPASKREDLIKLMSSLKSERITPLMIECLQDPDQTVRTYAISGLGSVASPEAMRSLLQSARKKLQPDERRAMIAALWKLSAKDLPAKKPPRKRASRKQH